MNRGPRLLPEWERPWSGFVAALSAALKRSGPRLESECGGTGTSVESLSSSLLLHALCLAGLLILPTAIRPKVTLVEVSTATHLTYRPGPYLPKIKDAAGAEAGESGGSGGKQGFNPRQVIRVSRGKAAEEKILDAPKLHLEKRSQLANLIAMSSAAAPVPPAEAIRKQLKADPQLARNSYEVVQPAATPPAMQLSKLRMQSMSSAVVQPVLERVERQDLRSSKIVLPNAEVVPPPPEVAKLRLPTRAAKPEMASAVVQPAPSTQEIAKSNNRNRNLLPQSDVIQPAPSIEEIAKAAEHRRDPLPQSDAVQPAPATMQLARNGSAVPQVAGYAGLAPSAVSAPQPAVSHETASAGIGGGIGQGDQKIQAIVISGNPGNNVGVPSANEGGTIALSPKGHSDKGSGGSGGGSGTAKGPESGSGATGIESGSVEAGAGAGADINAKNGTSGKPGPGGTGTGAGEPAVVSGITVTGGGVTLPSFGGSNVPLNTSRSKVLGPRHPPAITVVGSERSGGALNRYGALKGGKVYTIYIQTRLGTAVLEFAERATGAQKFDADLTAPEPMESELPDDVHNSRMVVSCVIGSDGVLRNMKVLESAASDMTRKIISALHDWRFRPVLRGDEAIAVDAILGFDIDTR
ncbi:MAG: hypothetical protein JWO13_1609 [Acidobacteriales bacterium]|nr:hypothetical protein [Terriglobales bacterium]